MKKILVAAGGTGGHIYPGLAIADCLKASLPDAQITFVGSHVGMEKNIVPKYGYPMEFIRARGFERQLSLETLAAIKGIFDSIADSKKLLKKYQPDLVIGTGGFTCGMLLKEAAKGGIPTMIHEQNAFPGRSNRMLASKVDRIAISFKEAKTYFPEEKTVFTGNPVRAVFKTTHKGEARRELGIKDGDRLILAVGGSQGARSINTAMAEMMSAHPGDHRVYYHLTGRGQYQAVCDKLTEAGVTVDGQRVRVAPFSTEMHTLLSASDLVITRSGAMSIAEIAAVGVPSILVPYPMAAGDHQRVNAQAIVDLGGGCLIEDATLTGEVLDKKVSGMLGDSASLAAMGEAVKAYGCLDADEKIAKIAMDLL